MAVSEYTNPLSEAIDERDIERPDTIYRFRGKNRKKAPSHSKRDWHPIAAAVATLGSLLSQKGHRWNKGEKLLYRRAVLSVKHPCCPTCGKPMNESAVTTDFGLVHKSWYCERDQNL